MPVGASTAGAIVGAIINYALNYRFTFASRRAHHDQRCRASAPIAAAGVVLNARGAVRDARIRPAALSQSRRSSRPVRVLIAGFLANRKWTF